MGACSVSLAPKDSGHIHLALPEAAQTFLPLSNFHVPPPTSFPSSSPIHVVSFFFSFSFFPVLFLFLPSFWGSNLDFHTCYLSFFSCCYKKILCKNTLREKKFILLHRSRVHFGMMRGSRWKGCNTAGHVASTTGSGEGRRGRKVTAQLSSHLHSSGSQPGDGATNKGWFFPPRANQNNSPQAHTEA